MKKFVMVLIQIMGFVLGAAALFSIIIIGMDLINRQLEDKRGGTDTED